MTHPGTERHAKQPRVDINRLAESVEHVESNPLVMITIRVPLEKRQALVDAARLGYGTTMQRLLAALVDQILDDYAASEKC